MNVDSDVNRQQINFFMRITFVTAEYIAFIFKDMLFSLQMPPNIFWLIKVQQSLVVAFVAVWLTSNETEIYDHHPGTNISTK